MIINMGIIIVNTSETQSSLLTTVALLQAVLELLSHMIFINSFFFFQLVFEFILILKLMACNMSQKSWDWELPKARKVNVL